METAESASHKQHVGLFFDVDGTLSDSYLLGYNSTNEVLRRNGCSQITEEEYHAGTKYTTPMRLAWHVTGNPDDSIGTKLGQEFDALYVALVSKETANLFSGIEQMLRSLQERHPSVRFAALSNACTDYVTAVLQANNLLSLFPVGLGADKVPAAKPAPDGLLQLCSLLDIPPTACVYVGDSPSDGKAAVAAGMHSIGVTWGSHASSAVQAAFPSTVHTVADLHRELERFVDQRQ